MLYRIVALALDHIAFKVIGEDRRGKEKDQECRLLLNVYLINVGNQSGLPNNGTYF